MKRPTRADRKRKAAFQQQPARNTRKIVLVLLTVGILLASGFWFSRPGGFGSQSPASLSAAAQTGFQQLKGKWARAEGGYLIEIKSIDDHGRMAAAYLNPRPVRVARADAFREGTSVRVKIELRDEGYPGSTYDLIYDERSGVLRGKYYQPEINEYFDVVFVKRS